ncbi:twin-arginine translocase TatA/TatE family subunit [Marisediminicola sp. UYEF4]|uniref:twin-arginine translocase TatA/TatE family subunit n=1 Tax=Marisediminicola sp. UYEF4 TaxID=1756384 RepID=UPI0033979D0D
MFQNLTGWHAIIILVVILLLFGAAKLPALAKSVGQSMKIFKNEIKTGAEDGPTPQAEPMQNSSQASPPATPTEQHPKP